MTSSSPIIFTPFSSTSVDFESYDGVNPAFGILKLNVNSFASTSKAIDLQFAIDNSGSMDDKCADGRTKQTNVNFTAGKMIQYLQSHNIPTNISVDSFDDHVLNVVNSQELSQDNLENIVDKINQIKPNGGTNIAIVLDKEAKWTQGIVLKERIFVLFTDGQATTGRAVNAPGLIILSHNIHPATTIVTIGCGTNHDYEALSGIASRKNGIYKFVSGIEAAAFACGEVLDKIINKVLEDCSITITNGEIWDWKLNEWTDKTDIDNVVGECNKTYHVRSSTPALFSAEFTGIIVETCEPYQTTIDQINLDQDVRKHIWRQKTLELLHNAKMAKKREATLDIKKKLKEHLVKMKTFMDENLLRDDLFMQTLCDDIFTTFNAVGTYNGQMFISSRQTSQATQGIHTNVLQSLQSNIEDDDEEDVDMFNSPQPSCQRQVSIGIAKMTSEIEDEELNGSMDFNMFPSSLRNCSMMIPPPPVLKRTKTIEEKVEDDVMRRHQTISTKSSPYANDKTLQVMREISCEDESNP